MHWHVETGQHLWPHYLNVSTFLGNLRPDEPSTGKRHRFRSGALREAVREIRRFSTAPDDSRTETDARHRERAWYSTPDGQGIVDSVRLKECNDEC